MIRRTIVFATAAALSAIFGTLLLHHAEAQSDLKAGPAQVDAQRLTAADHEPGNWMSYSRTYSEQRYSPLDQINASNVGNLKLAWYLDLDTSRGQEATPLVVDGVMYVSTAWSMVKALDAKTGRLLWSYDPQVPREILIKICCDAVNRGVAVWKGKVFVGTLDGRLIALNAANGKPVWSVQTFDKSRPYTITSAPRAINDRVIIGSSGSEYGVRGFVSAYDTNTGKLAWRFYTVPGDPSKPFEQPILREAAKTWHGQWWKTGGGGTVWGAIAYDPDLDLIYFGTANGVEWVQKYRSPGGGDNWFLASILAVKASNGSYAWHYQVVPGDVWDYDTTQDMVLADLTINGRRRKVLMHAAKDGFFYVLDRRTGELISAKPFVPVTWAKGIDLKTGRPIENPNARYDKTGKPIDIKPAPFGGHNWQPIAFNPQTRLVYIPAQEMDFAFAMDTSYKRSPVSFNIGISLEALPPPTEPAAKKAAWDKLKGYLIAWDPVGQRPVWRAADPGPWNGGVMTSAGNLVAEGDAAGNFTIYRADDGQKLWSMPVQSGIVAGPMSYEVNGQQYIAVLAGWGGGYPVTGGELLKKSGNGRNISRVLAFKLDGSAKLPPLPVEQAKVLNPPAQTANAATIDKGRRLYGRYCVGCHGFDAVSSGLVPDLRYSGFLSNKGWFEIVLGGALKKEGMVSFKQVLDHDRADAIRSYIIQRAIDTKTSGEAYAGFSAPR
ncbi:MAG: PQQ-dependent dehydrogenase, methanol/ethanol family [Deltaproteobacteria bacterium]|nr:PQQ-dependent dehydrogenase, methanol/ethanol family [Deltaproteobacteria bacterium]